jgi:hypothetical protein
MATRILKHAISPLFWTLPHDTRRYLFSRCYPGSFQFLQEMRTRIASGEDHTYRPFDEHKCIFIHVPKCAGISVSTSLFGNLSGGHVPIRTYSLVFNKLEFDTYFKFAFVRNPWDRVASGYFYLRDGSGLQSLSENRPLFERMKRVIGDYSDFDGFVKGWIKRENIHTLHLFAPQRDYLCLKGRQSPMNFIGYFENLHDDYAYIKQQIGVGSELLLLNRSRSSETSFVDLYSDATRRIVEEVYRDDIEIFGYSFDNSSLRTQLSSRHVEGTAPSNSPVEAQTTPGLLTTGV